MQSALWLQLKVGHALQWYFWFNIISSSLSQNSPGHLGMALRLPLDSKNSSVRTMAKKILPLIAFLKTAPHLKSSCEANLKNVCGRHSAISICHPWLWGSALTSDYKLTLCCAPNPNRMMNVLEEDVETIPGLKHKIDFFKVSIVNSHWGAVWTPSCWAAHWQCGI